MKNMIKNVPIPTAGLALGLVSLGILLHPYSEVLYFAMGILSSLFILLLSTKIAMYPRMVLDDLKSPILAGVFGTYFMTLMQLATYLAAFSFAAACALWCAAILAHACLIVYFTSKFLFKLDLTQVYPSYFIAYIGIVVAALTSPTFGLQSFGFGIFCFGFACYMALLVLVTIRYIKHEVPEPAKPLFCIYAAPMSLSLAAYFSVVSTPSFLFVLVLTVAAQLFLIAVLTQLPKLLRLKFYPSYAAMTFPFVISANALAKATAFFAMHGASDFVLTSLNVLVIAQTVFAAAMVLYVLCRYVVFFLGNLESKALENAVPEQSA